MINVLHISPVGMAVGGTEEVITQLCNHLDPAKFTNSVWSPFGGGQALDALRGQIKAATTSARAEEVAGFMSENAIDLVLMHSGALNKHYILAPLRFCQEFANLPVVEVMHRPLPSWGAPYGIDRIVAVSDYVAAQQEPAYRDRVVTIPNGYDEAALTNSPAQRAAARAFYGIAADAKVIGFIGNLAGWKRPLDLIEAVPLITRALPEALFLIAGDGPLRPKMEERIRELGLTNVRLLGFTPFSERVNYFAALDLFCFPSAEEAFALVVVEAMGMGLPVVTYDHGPMPEFFAGYDNKDFLVPFKDVPKLADAVVRILQDRSAGQRLAEENLRTARQRYSIKVVAQRYGALIADLRAKAARPVGYAVSAGMHRHLALVNLLRKDNAAFQAEYGQAVAQDPAQQALIKKDLADFLLDHGQKAAALAALTGVKDEEAEKIRRRAQAT
jgi:glycosyltransferase involved in cell wall biosynthesis